MTNLRIHLFGGLLLESGGRVLPRIPSRVGRSLFAYLVMNRDRELSRDLLAGTFWPDMPDNQARRRLSQSLWQIQTHLAESGVTGEFIKASSDSVRFDQAAAYWLDVEAFELGLRDAKDGSIDPRNLAATVDLYRGDLLSGFYDDWFVFDQSRLRDAYLDALSILSNQHKSRGEFDEALVYARRLALNDPLREEAHREVMRLCYLAGRPNEALLQYEICYSTLQDELGTEPAPETTELFESIAAEREAGSVPFTPEPTSPLLDKDTPIPLVGRRNERAVGLSLMESALAAQGGVVLIEGSPGVGKTRFLDSLVEDANWRGLGVLRGDAGIDRRSYAPLASALERSLTHLRVEQLSAQVEPVWLTKIARLAPMVNEWIPNLPPSAPLRPTEELQSMLEAISHVLVGLSRVSPYLLVLDDFHASDEDTLQAVRHLGNLVADSRIAICLSYIRAEARKREAVWDGLREIDALPHTRRISLEPLSRQETAELIRLSTGSEMPSARVDELYDETGGNPLYVLETLRAQHEHQVAAASGSPHRLPNPLPVPDSVQDAIGTRIAALAPSELELLQWLAVTGMESEAEVLLTANPRPRPEFFTDLETLTRRGIVALRDGKYRFMHQQVQRVVASGISDPIPYHEAIAKALEALHPDWPETIAYHYGAAGQARWAAMYSEQAAARALRVRAYGNAAGFFRDALANAGEAELDAETRFRLMSGLEGALDVLGERAAQAEILESMSNLGDELEGRRSAIIRRVAWYQAHTDRFDEAEKAVSEALRIDLEAADDAAIAEDYLILGMVGLWSGNTQAAIDHLERSVDHARGERLAEATEALSRALGAAQRYEEATVQAERALGLFVAADNRRGQAEALGSLGIISMERGEAEASLDFYRRAINVCRAIGYRHGEGVNLVNHANALWYAGRAGEALDQFEEAIWVFRTLDNRRGEAVAQANAASLYHTLGDDNRAEAYSETALAYFEEVHNDDGVAQVLCNLADIARTRRLYSDGRDHLETALGGIRQSNNHWLEIQALHSLALLELESGNNREAIEAADEALGVSRTYGLGDFAANLLSIRGMAQLAEGRLREARESTEEAMKKLHPGANRAYLIPHRHAVVLAAAGENQAASAFANQAADLLEQALAGLTPDRMAAARAVPEHQRILSAIETVVEVQLPREDVPTGRPLTPEDHIGVSWTVHAPADELLSDATERRGKQILRLIDEAAEAGAIPTIEALAEHLTASVRTIRRDIAALRKAGHEVRTRGARKTV